MRTDKRSSMVNMCSMYCAVVNIEQMLLYKYVPLLLTMKDQAKFLFHKSHRIELVQS